MLQEVIKNKVQHYNPKKYWNYREKVINPEYKNKLLKYYYLYKIKKSDAFNNSSMGTYINKGAKFKTQPILPHGLNGIIISYFATIGSNCVIRQQVTIAQNNNNESAIIGDNVVIGAGAKIIGKVVIGNNVIIGANAVVTHDIPDNCVAVGVPARVIKKVK